MPSKKKKKAKGKGRAAAKSSKDKGLKDDSAGSDVKPDVKNVELRMQRLQMNNNVQDDETALLEEAINLAAAEREQLGAAARNDEESDKARCDHGFCPLPRGHVCARFIKAIVREFPLDYETADEFEYELKNALMSTRKYADVWHNPDMLQLVISHFLAEGMNMLLGGKDGLARQSAAYAKFFEQWRAVKCGAIGDFRSQHGKIEELSSDSCDEHTVVSFFKKRIPCKCLNRRYNNVKSIPKLGICNYQGCLLPDRKTERSKLMHCERCRAVYYCSIECQKLAWPSHKEFCIEMSKV